MGENPDRRENPRLQLSYPIRVHDLDRLGLECGDAVRGRPLGHTVTQNLCARGAYFHTYQGAPYKLGLEVTVEVSVRHRLATDGKEITLDLRGEGRVVRVESPSRHAFGESGVTLTGVAVEFAKPLDFHYCWA